VSQTEQKARRAKIEQQLRKVSKIIRRAALYQLVRNATDHNDDPILLEAVRRAIGRQIQE
jgi:hypothetical protein